MNTKYAFRKYLLVFLPVIMIFSCKKSDKGFLDKTDVGQMNQNTVFADSLLTFQFLNGVYADLPTTYYMDNGVTGGGLWSYSDASDDSECRWSGTTAQAAPAFNLAQFASLADFSRFKNHWNSAFTNIRRVNVFLGNVDRSPISAARKQKLKGEARFLRAYYYYHLLRNYSGLPLLGDRLFGLTDDFNLPRSSFAETVSYISSELDACSGMLPLNQLPEDYGRPTKGAAMALKSRLLLLAASPLFNGENPATGGEQKKLAGYENFDANRWKLAADAAKAVMDLNLYQLVEDNTTSKGYGFYKTLTDRKNSEQIFQIMMKTGRWYESYLLPVTRGGQAYSYPTQSLVDAYPMANGKMKDEAGSGYSETDMYKNRDPRFGYTILYNQATWLDKTTNKPSPVNLYFQAPGDGLGTSNSTRTGYLFRKFCNENAGGNYGVTSDIGLVSLRYAEILLNYAEAENEFQGPGAQVYAAVEAIRRRAGLDPYQLPGSLSKDDMRQVIRNERRVEFAFEEAHRFFDVKRWKIAEKVLNGDAIGMRWVKNGNAYTGTRFAFETRVFLSPQMYYFPIPQSEINKSSLLIQNPGW